MNEKQTNMLIKITWFCISIQETEIIGAEFKNKIGFLKCKCFLIFLNIHI